MSERVCWKFWRARLYAVGYAPVDGTIAGFNGGSEIIKSSNIPIKLYSPTDAAIDNWLILVFSVMRNIPWPRVRFLKFVEKKSGELFE